MEIMNLFEGKSSPTDGTQVLSNAPECPKSLLFDAVAAYTFVLAREEYPRRLSDSTNNPRLIPGRISVGSASGIVAG